MGLDFDERKSQSNKEKHGIDFTEAQALWDDPELNEVPKRVNVDFPAWMIHSLDKEANRLGVTRQSIIKVWISERLGHRPA
ncbi:MAG: BrnT family toxin [Elusimicrobia bacterium]|nr:BrnT family toxin [Elusimicrobiota bacterium]